MQYLLDAETRNILLEYFEGLESIREFPDGAQFPNLEAKIASILRDLKPLREVAT